MATLTIRNLDENTKQALRERAASNGNSMEEEARLLLGRGTQTPASEPPAAIENVSLRAPVATQAITPATTQATIELNQRQRPQSIDPDYPARGKSVLLIITGSVAAYKSLELVRRLKERGVDLQVVMTRAAKEFLSPLQVGALSHTKIYDELFSREDEHDVGHIRLARQADLIVVAPATANTIAKMANGFADDLASAILLAARSNILIAPAMNPAMWKHKATQRNVATLTSDGVNIIGPEVGEMAEDREVGRGRLVDVWDVVEKIGQMLDDGPKPLTGLKAVLTAGPTHEPIDPVRYIANRSSGKQGYEIATALARAGAQVDLVSGPVNLPAPPGVNRIMVESARDMKAAVEALMPADIAIMVAAVADWRSANSADEKIKKKPGQSKTLSLEFTQNPDILKSIGHHKNRPSLVVGFAAETQNVVENAKIKLGKKGADWILANDVSPETGIMGGDNNTIKLLSREGVEQWPSMSKGQVARQLVEKIISHFENQLVSV